MPTYEYACSSCGEHLEVVQSFRDDPLTTCPACGGDLRKVFGSVGVVFKGSGFYKTDSRPSKGSSGDAKPAATESISSSASSGDGKSGSSTSSGSSDGASTSSGSSGSSGGSDSSTSSGSTPKAAAS